MSVTILPVRLKTLTAAKIAAFSRIDGLENAHPVFAVFAFLYIPSLGIRVMSVSTALWQ
jgi:hypothetical protein